MAKANSTSSTRSTSAPHLDPTTAADFREMAIRLNECGALLAGVEDICNTDDMSGDALSVAATVCRQINTAVCRMADRLSAAAEARLLSRDPIIVDGGNLPTQAATRIEGAYACLDAIHQSRKTAHRIANTTDIDNEQYHLDRDAAKAVIIKAAGPVPTRAAGALALLAELVVELQGTDYGIADLLDQVNKAVWQPEATMTEPEVAAARAAFDARVTEDRACALK